MVPTPRGSSRLIVLGPHPGSFDIGNGRRNAASPPGFTTTRPRGLRSSDATFATSLQVAIPMLRSSPQPRLTSSRRRTATGSGWPMSAWDPVRSR